MKVFAELLGIVFGVCLFGFAAVLWTPQKISIPDLQKQTVLITVPDGHGTGVLFSRKGQDGHFTSYIWTVAHVVIQDPDLGSTNLVKSVTVRIGDKDYDAAIVDYAYLDQKNDLALLRVWDEDVSQAQVEFRKTTHSYTLGSRAIHVGNLFGENLINMVTIGTLGKHDSNSGHGIMDVYALQVAPGSSGGGVYDESGHCLGLVDMMVGASTITAVIPAETIRSWAHSRGLDWAVDPSVPAR